MSDVHFEHDAGHTHEGSHFSQLPLRFSIVTALAADSATTVTGINANDELVFVGHIGFDTDAMTTEGDVTSEFTITDDDEITQSEGTTSLTDDLLLVIWNRKHPNA